MKTAVKFLLPVLLINCFLSGATAAPQEIAPSARESIEWCDVWIPHANETNLPRVLLLGDSIARGYRPQVEKKLAGKAYVAQLATSRFISDPALLGEIAVVLDNTKFDIIHFNNGLHGFQHTDQEYREAFPKFLETIKAHAPNAKLIWATSTPRRENNAPAENARRNTTNDRVAARNAIALEIIKPLNLPVDDLFPLVAGRPELYNNDGVHFNDQGVEIEATQVAAEVGKLLAR